jgi:hypothetical protein
MRNTKNNRYHKYKQYTKKANQYGGSKKIPKQTKPNKTSFSLLRQTVIPVASGVVSGIGGSIRRKLTEINPFNRFSKKTTIPQKSSIQNSHIYEAIKPQVPQRKFSTLSNKDKKNILSETRKNLRNMQNTSFHSLLLMAGVDTNKKKPQEINNNTNNNNKQKLTNNNLGKIAAVRGKTIYNISSKTNSSVHKKNINTKSPVSNNNGYVDLLTAQQQKEQQQKYGTYIDVDSDINNPTYMPIN